MVGAATRNSRFGYYPTPNEPRWANDTRAWRSSFNHERRSRSFHSLQMSEQEEAVTTLGSDIEKPPKCPVKSNSHDSLSPRHQLAIAKGFAPPGRGGIGERRLRSSSQASGTGSFQDDDNSSESSVCEDYDYNSSGDSFVPYSLRSGVGKGSMPRSNSYAGVSGLGHLPKAQSMLSFSQYQHQAPLGRAGFDSSMGTTPAMRKVKSYQNAMSEMHNGVNAMELVANLHAEIQDLNYVVNQRERQTSQNKPTPSHEPSGLFGCTCWYAAITANLLYGARVFTTQFLHYMKQDLQLRRVTVRVVGRYVRQAASRANPSVLNRSKLRKPPKGFSLSSVYRSKNRDIFRAASWSSPFLVFAFLIFNQQLDNLQPWVVLCSCLYSGTVPMLTKGSNLWWSRINIGTNALYLLNWFHRLISQFDNMRVK